MSEAGCYVLDVYCDARGHDGTDGRNDHWDQFTGPNRQSAVRMARSAGWKKSRDGEWTCPTCADPSTEGSER